MALNSRGLSFGARSAETSKVPATIERDFSSYIVCPAAKLTRYGPVKLGANEGVLCDGD